MRLSTRMQSRLATRLQKQVASGGVPTDALLQLKGATGVANQGSLGGSGSYAGGMGTVTDGGVTVFSFDGSNDYIDSLNGVADYSFIQNTLVFSIVTWAKFDSTTSRDIVCGTELGTSGKGFFFMRENASGFGLKQMRVSIHNGTLGVPVIGAHSTTIINDTDWHSVGVSGDGSSIKFYIDGSDAGTNVIAAFTSFSSGNSTRVMNVGRSNHTSTFLPMDGLLQDVQIYDRTLSATEFSDIHAAGR